MIKTGFRDEGEKHSIYRHVLGVAFDTLPPSIKQLHDSAPPRSWSGTADVTRGKGLIAFLIATVVGFPQRGNDVPVRVTFLPMNGGELWTPTFGGRRFKSFQSSGKGRDRHLLVERFGIAKFALALVVEDGRLALIPRRWSVFDLPMPNVLLPGGNSFESETDGQFHFDVTIAVPWVGLIVAYRGTLVPDG